ncbi:MAG: hypothetical protein H6935_06080 [Thiobacillus sp.]|nr:hypothetical protein [Thiobacillus sp.]
MKPLTILALLLLAGCTSNLALKDTSNAAQAVGTLNLHWLQPNSIEVTLEGRRYKGDWTMSRCLPADYQCRGPYLSVPKVHRRHISQGQATLTSREGDSLECKWVSHLPDVRGTCRTQDGRLFSLEESKPVG